MNYSYFWLVSHVFVHHVFKCHPFIMTLALQTVIIIGAVVLSLANFCSRSHYSRDTFILKL